MARHSSAGGDEIHPRLEAAMNAAQFHGMALDPGEFPASAASNCRPPRRSPPGCKRRHVGTRGTATVASTHAVAGRRAGGAVVHRRWRRIVGRSECRAQRCHAQGSSRWRERLRHCCGQAAAGAVWSGEAVLLRAARVAGGRQTVGLSWLAGLVLQERRSLRDVGLASLTLSFLTIFPPLLVMSVVNKVLPTIATRPSRCSLH